MIHWFDQPPAGTDNLVISTRVRLARNFADMPFPTRMDEGQQHTCRERIAAVLAAKGYRFDIVADLQGAERQRLVERHTASPGLLAAAQRSALARNEDESLSVLVMEEDAARIQAFASGLALEECRAAADAVDDLLFPDGAVAFDPKRGYLTVCPTNLGTGLRASVLVHLPALTWAGQLQPLQQALSQNGMTVRGFYGEGSKAQGHFYQLSNQVTLGLSEEELLSGLANAVEQVKEMENGQRRAQMLAEGLVLQDRLMRAVGLLERALLLPLDECMHALSAVWLAADLELYQPPGPLRRLLTAVQPATLLANAQGDEKNPDALRADVVRTFFKG